jgi:hypothetical protein
MKNFSSTLPPGPLAKPESTGNPAPLVVWHRRGRRLAFIGLIVLMNAVLVLYMAPNIWGLLGWLVCTVPPLWYARSAAEPDHEILKADLAGVWIKGLPDGPLPWSAIASVRGSLILEASPCLCFNLKPGPLREELLNPRGGKPLELLDGPCDLAFAVPIHYNSDELLSKLRELMQASKKQE